MAKKSVSDMLRFNIKMSIKNDPDAERAVKILRSPAVRHNITRYIVQAVIYYTRIVRPDIWEESEDVELEYKEDERESPYKNTSVSKGKKKKEVMRLGVDEPKKAPKRIVIDDEDDGEYNEEPVTDLENENVISAINAFAELI